MVKVKDIRMSKLGIQLDVETSSFTATCLFTRLEESSSVSDSQVSAENVIYEAFVLIGGIGWCFYLLPSWRKGEATRS